MKTGTDLLDLAYDICMVLESMFLELFKDDLDDLQHIMIDEDINRSHYIDIFKNAKGDLVYRVVKKGKLLAIPFGDTKVTTQMKLFTTLLTKYDFHLQKDFENFMLKTLREEELTD